jgi:hypothetical protein
MPQTVCEERTTGISVGVENTTPDWNKAIAVDRPRNQPTNRVSCCPADTRDR